MRLKLIKLKKLLKETEEGDRVKREHAIKSYREILKGMKNGNIRPVGGIYSSKKQWKVVSKDINSIPEQFDFKVLFVVKEKKKKSARAAFQKSVYFMGNETTPTIRIYIEEKRYKNEEGSRNKKLVNIFEDKREEFIHEFTHYLDRKRIPDLPYTSEIGKEYFNDPRELNAYYQQALGELTSKLKNNPDYLEDKIEEWESFSKFKNWMFSNIFDSKFIKYLKNKHKKRIIKRLYKFYDKTLPKIQQDFLVRGTYE